MKDFDWALLVWACVLIWYFTTDLGLSYVMSIGLDKGLENLILIPTLILPLVLVFRIFDALQIWLKDE